MDLVVCSFQRHGGHSRRETGVRQLQCAVPTKIRFWWPGPWLGISWITWQSPRGQAALHIAGAGTIVCFRLFLFFVLLFFFIFLSVFLSVFLNLPRLVGVSQLLLLIRNHWKPKFSLLKCCLEQHQSSVGLFAGSDVNVRERRTSNRAATSSADRCCCSR